mmetsp:Transcript_23386/g.48945  ORF Transcript_23386/g.48945 Transcript_23386/m.48945 type:complete len:138 (+) Transcript_23386:380-793(+)
MHVRHATLSFQKDQPLHIQDADGVLLQQGVPEYHGKSGRHKEKCGKSLVDEISEPASRKSIVFDNENVKMNIGPGLCTPSINHQVGCLGVDGLNKDQRLKLKQKNGLGYPTFPNQRMHTVIKNSLSSCNRHWDWTCL